MYEFKTKDGRTVVGETAREVVENLRSAAWMPRSDIEEYIRKTAYFTRLQTGRRIRTETAEAMIADLCSAGLLLRIQ